jgi:putative glycosyltransferase
MGISIVTTLYHSAPYLRAFYKRISETVRQVSDDYEMIFVNDGSPDDALAVALALRREDEHIKVVDLSRNFGHHAAMMIGLRHAEGERIFLIDCDLEEDPELLERFAEVQGETGADVVYGVQDVRRGGWFQRVSGRLYYKAINLLAQDPLPENLLTIRLMSRRYVEALLQHGETELNIAGVWVRTGFLQVPVPVQRKPKGSSTYNLARKIAVFVNAITSMSAKPLVFIFYLGTLISATAAFAAFVLIVRQLFFGEMLAGWPSLIVSIWLLGGLTIFCQGLIGIYLGKVLMESKRRPIAIVRAVHDHLRAGEGSSVERVSAVQASDNGCSN